VTRRLLIIIISLIFTAILMAGVSYALFTDITQADPIEISADEETSVVEIGNEYDLRLYAFDRYHNPDHPVSEYDLEDNQGARESLRLTSNILLSYDLVINRDINLDLGQYSIDLNGHTIFIEHPYHGTLTLQGTDGITSFTSTGDKSGVITLITPHTNINMVKISDDNNLIWNIDPTEAQLVERIFSLATLHGHYYKDITLLTHYYAYDINFEWTSSAPQIVASSGRIVAFPEENAQTVTMTLKLTSPLFEGEHTQDYPIEIGAEDDRLSYGLEELNAFFDAHKYGTDTIYIYRDTWLLKGNDYYDLAYSYQVIDPIAPPSEYAPDLDTSGYVLKKNMLTRSITLAATVKSGTDEDSINFNITVIVEDNLEIANNIVSDLELYLVSNEETVIELPTYEDLADYGIKEQPTFSFVGNEDGYYRLEYDEELGKYLIKVNTLPDTGDEIYVRMGFSFVTNTPEYVEKDVQIFYIDASGLSGDESLDRYALMYILLNEMVNERTSGRTYKSFSMPVEILGYDVEYYLQTPEGFPEGEYAPIVITSDESISLFDIDPTKAPITDTTIIIIYRFQGQTEDYTKFSFFTLPGIINNNEIGILDTVLYNAIVAEYDIDEDEVLTTAEAAAEKAKFTLPEESATVQNTFKGLEFLTRTRGFSLKSNSFAKSDAVYLQNNRVLTFLDLSNSGLTESDLDTFEHLDYLEELILSGNSFANLNQLKMSHTIHTLDLDDTGLENIDKLQDYDTVQTLYIQNNEIRLFDTLKEMEGLDAVYLYSQTIEGDTNDYGAEGKYNISIYNLLVNRGVKIYNSLENDEPKLYVPNAYIAEASAVLESIMLNSHTTTTIVVPSKIYVGSTTSGSNYEIDWDFVNFSSTPAPPAQNDIITFTHSIGSGTYELYASVTVGGETAHKIFFIKRS